MAGGICKEGSSDKVLLNILSCEYICVDSSSPTQGTLVLKGPIVFSS